MSQLKAHVIYPQRSMVSAYHTYGHENQLEHKSKSLPHIFNQH